MNDCGDAYKVYKLTSPSGKVYIGITMQPLEKRFMNGYGYKRCPVIYNAIKKYGWDNFKHEILFEGLTKEEAEKKEIELIAFYKSNQRVFGYNIENGGNTTGTHSEETKRKISEGNKGKIVTKESIEKRRKTIEKNGGCSGEKNSFYGKHHSEEVKKKQSELMKGNKYNLGNHHSKEFKKKKSAQMKEKYSNGGNPRCKRVLHFANNGTLKETFFSLREAARNQNVSPATMHKLINNKDCEVWQYE